MIHNTYDFDNNFIAMGLTLMDLVRFSKELNDLTSYFVD